MTSQPQTHVENNASNITVHSEYLPTLNQMNFTTGKEYQNSNQEKLVKAAIQKGYTSHEWATLRQWNANYEAVAKGENGIKITFYKRETVNGKIDEVLKVAVVFNRCQLQSSKNSASDQQPT